MKIQYKKHYAGCGTEVRCALISTQPEPTAPQGTEVYIVFAEMTSLGFIVVYNKTYSYYIRDEYQRPTVNEYQDFVSELKPCADFHDGVSKILASRGMTPVGTFYDEATTVTRTIVLPP